MAMAFPGTASSYAQGRAPLATPYYYGAGNLWGVTRVGSQSDTGTVFKVATATGVLTTVRNFGFLTGANSPENGLTADGKGYMWALF